MLNEFSENLNSIKKEPVTVMKDTLSEMKNILQGINTRVDEAENPMSDLE